MSGRVTLERLAEALYVADVRASLREHGLGRVVDEGREFPWRRPSGTVIGGIYLPWSDLPGPSRTKYLDRAEAVQAALREPAR